jgi:hypothetical protein
VSGLLGHRLWWGGPGVLCLVGGDVGGGTAIVGGEIHAVADLSGVKLCVVCRGG